MTAPPDEPVALITDLVGEVSIRRQGEEAFLKCASDCFLFPGDETRTGSDGSAALHQKYLAVERLTGSQTRKISAVPYASGDVVTAEMFDSYRKLYADAWQRATRPLLLLSPRYRVSIGSPRFEWTGPPGARYELNLSDNAGKPYWRACTERTSLDYPAGKLHDSATNFLWACNNKSLIYPAEQGPLPSGSYRWDVTAHTVARSFYALASFTVASRAQAAAVDTALEGADARASGPGTSNLADIAALLQQHQYRQVELRLKEAAMRKPTGGILKELLRQVCLLTQR